MIYLDLIYEFLRVGLFAVGGGLATIPFLYDIAERMAWIMAEDISDMIAISQATPGPIGINMATFTGVLTAGTVGGFLAPFGLVLPSFVIIVVISRILQRFQKSEMVKRIFYGLRPASLSLIAGSWMRIVRITFAPEMLWQSPSDFFWSGVALFVGLWFLVRKYRLHPIWLILLSAIFGILFG